VAKKTDTNHGKFCDLTLIKKSRMWLSQSFEKEFIPLKHRLAIASQFKLPQEFWDGTFQLPSRRVDIINEEEAIYEKRIKSAHEEIQRAKEEILILQKKLIQAYEETNELRTQLKLLTS
jgi:hypothetical protein